MSLEALNANELNTLRANIEKVFEFCENKRTFSKPRKEGGQIKPLKSMFGFVPVIEDSKLNLYIKLGGPELVRFGQTLEDGSSSKFPTVVESQDRDKLAHVLSRQDPERYGFTKREVKAQFPFRIIYIENEGYQLQYAKDSDSEYMSIKSNNTLKANIVSEIVMTALEYFGLIVASPDKNTTQLILKSAKSENGVGTILNLFMTKMKVDLNAYLTRIISHHYNNRAGSFFGLETLVVDVNEQHLADIAIEGFLLYPRTKEYNRNHESFNDFKKQFDFGIREVLGSISEASQSDAAVAEEVKKYVDLLGTSATSDLDTINTLTQANTDLRKELEAVKATVPSNPNLPKYLGVGAGLVSGYFAIQQDSAQELETWQKGAIVAASGLLGAVPYLNFVTIATMPYLVNKGVQLSGDDEFKASARARMAQARAGAGRIATSVGDGARRLASRQELAGES
jgi:hypothetical protein